MRESRQLGASQRGMLKWLRRRKTGCTASEVGKALWARRAGLLTDAEQLSRQWASRVLASLYSRGMVLRTYSESKRAYIWTPMTSAEDCPT